MFPVGRRIAPPSFHDARSTPRVRSGYTQNLEERYIVKHARGSRFLDIGAYDGTTLSSTRELVTRGWSGVYVEPNPLVLPALRDVAARSGSQVLPVALGTSCGQMPFYVNGDMVSSLNTAHRDRWAANSGLVFDTITVDVLDVNTLAGQIGYTYDVLNLDVEGLNWDVFQQFDLSKWTFNTVCIEFDDHFSDIQQTLERHRFRLVYASPENIVAVR